MGLGWGWDGVGGGGALSVGLVLNVTGKIGKAFNVMQYLSNQPIKITPNQSLPATFTSGLLNLLSADVHLLQFVCCCFLTLSLLYTLTASRSGMFVTSQHFMTT